ncbi:predicted protein [Aspergillus nidulans FGSC A4]|uniref:Uncharacterized protein n=1 Tax=Emericella nidulans (strain FGSC A4 / ATCC 38163 / CBS 112.46 / NRRL 194 / M139) TaxID=227321 RepID=Q5B7Z8_EMENI|nr:hypothetical protein [Aspergillus nidulans FGSC A4]EAA63300.1 predicted protein [Aspergillus nidulans FGSC A4]CBF82927.1 TPA: conserved hypothetical protein [Aspergillus nidulans FGSC A4]|eukprot:XP_660936.1 predicted protein [Aspergillus nidulans FGSC A4]
MSLYVLIRLVKPAHKTPAGTRSSPPIIGLVGGEDDVPLVNCHVILQIMVCQDFWGHRGHRKYQGHCQAYLWVSVGIGAQDIKVGPQLLVKDLLGQGRSTC